MNRLLCSLALVPLLAPPVVAWFPPAPLVKHGKSTGFATPEAAFAGYKKAMEKRDWKGVFAAMTPDSGDRMVGALVAVIGAVRKQGQFEEIAKEIEKAGVKAEAMEEAGKAYFEAQGDGKKLADLCRKLAAPIKDKPALLGEITTRIEKLNGSRQLDAPEITLKGVKIDGNKATATLVTKQFGREMEAPVRFEKASGWLMVLPEETFGVRGK